MVQVVQNDIFSEKFSEMEKNKVLEFLKVFSQILMVVGVFGSMVMSVVDGGASTDKYVR